MKVDLTEVVIVVDDVKCEAFLAHRAYLDDVLRDFSDLDEDYIDSLQPHEIIEELRNCCVAVIPAHVIDKYIPTGEDNNE